MTAPFQLHVKNYLHRLGVITSMSEGECLTTAETQCYIGECDSHGVPPGTALQSLVYPGLLPVGFYLEILGEVSGSEESSPSEQNAPAPATEPPAVATPEPLAEAVAPAPSAEPASVPEAPVAEPAAPAPSELPPVDEGFEASPEENNGTTQE